MFTCLSLSSLDYMSPCNSLVHANCSCLVYCLSLDCMPLPCSSLVHTVLFQAIHSSLVFVVSSSLDGISPFIHLQFTGLCSCLVRIVHWFAS